MKKKQSHYIVPALDRGLRVLDLLSSTAKPLTIAAICRVLKLPRASVFRILFTLQDKGLIEADAAGKTYQPGPGVLRLGYQFLSSRNVVQVAQSEVERLARQTGVSAHLAVRDGKDIVYLIHAAGNSNFVSNIGVGDRLPAHATPAGQLLLAELSKEEITALYKERTLEALTAQTPRSRRALGEAIESAAKTGAVVSRGAVHQGGKSIAAPVRDAGGKTVAVIDISGPDQAFEADDLESRYLPRVLDAASAISTRLGYVQDVSRLRR